MPRLSDYIIKTLPKEAQEAYTSKDTLTEWRYKPTHAADGDAFVEWCDECNQYHEYRTVSGWSVTPGKIRHLVWLINCYGDWDYNAGCDVNDSHYDEFLKENSYEAHRDRWKDYYIHVMETGKDPLGNFFVKDVRKLKSAARRAYKDLLKAQTLAAKRTPLRRIAKTLDGVAHLAHLGLSGYWQTTCGQVVLEPSPTRLEVVTCLSCLAK